MNWMDPPFCWGLLKFHIAKKKKKIPPRCISASVYINVVKFYQPERILNITHVHKPFSYQTARMSLDYFCGRFGVSNMENYETHC